MYTVHTGVDFCFLDFLLWRGPLAPLWPFGAPAQATLRVFFAAEILPFLVCFREESFFAHCFR